MFFSNNVNFCYSLFNFVVQSVTVNINNILILMGTNFAQRKKYVMIILNCMDLDYGLRDDHLAPLSSASTVKGGSNPIV